MTSSHTARHAEMLANRLRKTRRHRTRWARRQSLDAFRLYDRDIPEIPLAIDLYGGHLHIAEYARRGGLRGPGGDGDGEVGWVAEMARVAAAVHEVAADKVFTKTRRRMRGSDQYERLGAAGTTVVVQERGLSFRCNLSDYLDTGLFLDHRPTRALVAAEAAGKRVLNLFCYTGSFTVYAAAAGARATTSVDLSNTYLDWTGDNLSLNGLAGPQHQLVRDDVLVWLGAEASRGGRYDLIVLDPPTFSTSKRMTETLDIQRDHVALVQAALKLLDAGGVLWFSTNARRFRLVEAAFAGAAFGDMTAQTIPDDFRDRSIHRCWRAVRGDGA